VKDFPLNTDMSVAPEIAILAVPVQAPHSSTATLAQRPTIGVLAAELRVIADNPQRWWGLVGFKPGRYEKIGLGGQGFAAWVMVLAPGDPGHYCDCDVMTLIAGEVAEESVADGGGVTTALQPGRVRVHGQGQVHQIRAIGDGYAVSLHVRGE
jgi:hypothetical protein